MAVPDLSRATAASLLFTRLPDRLFSPLASENRQRYWALLCRLHERRFGPEAPLPPSRGFPTKVIIQDIAEALELMDTWDDEESCISETPTEVRAAWIFNRLYECGWLRIEQPRFDRKVTMQPAVSQFLTLLVSFAETGPVFVAGKIRSIDANVQLAASGQPESLGEAAEQSRNLLEHIRNTGTNIREFMDSLQQNVTTAQYVQRFFNEYIERVFIGDYRELRTKEHPLSKRGQILEKVEEIQESEELRNKLIAWYETKRCQGDRKKAERMFERDIQRLSELQRIDEYLWRLDEEIRRANKRALAFLDYRLRSLIPTDNLVKLAVQSLLARGEGVMADPFAPAEMISENALAEPRKPIERAAPSALRKTAVSDESLARANITNRARTNRTVTPAKIHAYLESQLAGKSAARSEELKVESITDVRIYQTLASVGMQMEAKGRKLRMDAMIMTPGFKVASTDEQEVPGEPISGVPFIIEARKPVRKSE